MLSFDAVNCGGASFLRRHFVFEKYLTTIFLFVLLAAFFARADEYTGSPQDDSKDLIPLHAAGPSNSNSGCETVGFLPLPKWSHLTTMPPLPDVLKPFGQPKTVASTTKPSLTPPKDGTSSNTTAASSDSSSNTPTKPAPAPTPDPDLIAVSPFLDWIRTNPQAAANVARQQAEVYHAGSSTAPETAVTAPATTVTPPVVAAPYWLPPMLDATPDYNQTPGSSAAIYSRPQR